MSGMLNIPILTAAQGRRPDGTYKTLPSKSSVADSYDIMRNANTGLFILKKDPTKKIDDDAIYIIKNRGGKDNIFIPINWDRPTNRMEEKIIK
jgi:hypothetical protein